jgi:hypothetical protein
LVEHHNGISFSPVFLNFRQSCPCPCPQFLALAAALAAKSSPPAEAVAPILLSEAIAACLAQKEASGHRPEYVRSLRQYLALFARGREAAPLATISVAELEAWFASRKEVPAVRSSNLGRLSALFAYAVRRAWIRENPCRRAFWPGITAS